MLLIYKYAHIYFHMYMTTYACTMNNSIFKYLRHMYVWVYLYTYYLDIVNVQYITINFYLYL